jgi:hypothetical protein
LKAEELEENLVIVVAVEQPEVRAGELVEKKAWLLVSAVMGREEAGTW